MATFAPLRAPCISCKDCANLAIYQPECFDVFAQPVLLLIKKVSHGPTPKPSGYFELTTSFAHRMMANAKENPVAQRTFSSKIQFLGSCSGSKLILTIFFPFLSKIFFRAQLLLRRFPYRNYKWRDCQIRTIWNLYSRQS